VNLIMAYLTHNWERLRLEPLGRPDHLSCLFITPRFRASAHVVCVIFSLADGKPCLVAKLPRLPEQADHLAHEANALSLVQRARPGGFASVPRPLAFEAFRGWPILLETALAGRPMTPAEVRRAPGQAVELVTRWLVELHRATITPASPDEWMARAVEEPLERLLQRLPPEADGERRLCEATRHVAEELRHFFLPLVFEHGDLSHPNILLSSGQVGVVDWELATPNGVPAADLFFFLTFVAFARRDARELDAHVEAFLDAFFGPHPRHAEAVGQYARALCLPEPALPALFALTWARYVAGLLGRLVPEGAVADSATLAWLRANRYFRLWQVTLERFDDLCLI